MTQDPTFIQAILNALSNPWILLLLFLYFMPTMISSCNRSSGAWPCFWVNLFFGWTFIGWFIAIVIGNLPSKKQLAYRDAVNHARDSFYLREEEKHQDTIDLIKREPRL